MKGWVAGLAYGSAILCTIGLGKPSLWIDEVHSFEFASLPSVWLVTLNAAARDAYPPLYFLLLHGWLQVGSDEIWLRMFSVLAHVASIPLMYLVGARLVSKQAGVVAAALLAVSPFHLAFAREVRMYSLVGFWSLLSMWGLLAYVQTRSRRAFWTLTLAGLALLYTHFMGVLLILAQGIWMLRESRRERLRPALKQWAAVLVIGFLPWAPLFLKAFVVTHGYAAEASPPLLLYWFVSAVGAGFGQARWVLAAAFAVVAALIVAGLTATPAGSKRRLLATWAFLPLILELVSSLLGKPVFAARTLIVCTPAWLLIMAQGLAAPPVLRAALGSVLLGTLAGLSYAHLLAHGLATAPGHREALAHILKHARRGDVIVHSSIATYHPLHEYYSPRSGSRLKDYLIESPGEFRAGRLGTWFRDVWRRLKNRADPGGVLMTGADPHRIGEKEFLDLQYTRVWHLHTTRAGKQKLWYLIPGKYYAPTPDQVKTSPFSGHAWLSRAFKGGPVAQYPGMTLELYQHR